MDSPTEKVDELSAMLLPLRDLISTDCLQHALSFLNYSEMCTFSAVNKSFLDLLSKTKNHLMNALLLEHPAFTVFIFGKWKETTGHPRFALQKQYGLDKLIQYSFHEMGIKGILKEDDMVIWQICHHFGWKSDLFAWRVNGEVWFDAVDGGYCNKGRLCDIDESSIPDLADECSIADLDKEMLLYSEWGSWDNWYQPRWGSVAGLNHTENEWRNDDDDGEWCPVVIMDSPGREWRNRFVQRHIKGDINEHMMTNFQLFSGYNKWEEESDYLIGYNLQCEYDLSDVLNKYTIDELGKKEILIDEDLIVWKLCKHFGFEMRRYFMVKGESRARSAPEGLFEYEEELWNDDDWQPHGWNITTCKVYDNCVGMVDRGDGLELMWMVIQIRCPSRC